MPTAMDIYKLLPKTNCGECKFPTCLAFAMQLANQKVSLETCPHVSPEAKAALEESGAPPIRLVTIGVGDLAAKMGDETQLFRHDKTFFHPTILGLIADDSSGLDAMTEEIETAKSLVFERVGRDLRVDAVGVRHSSGKVEDFLAAVKIASQRSFPIVLMTEDPKVMANAIALCRQSKPLIYRATPENFDAMAEAAKTGSLPLVLGGAPDLQALSLMSDKARKIGVVDIVLEPGRPSAAQLLEDMTMVRRAATKNRFRPLGYPTITVLGRSDIDLLRATLGVMKYSSMILLEEVPREFLIPLMVLRQNLFTDPQVPIQVKAGLYAVGEANEASLVLITTNFSLTYFTVRADIEKSKVPVWLLVVDTDGQSVMTSFAAGKLTPESVTKAVETWKIKEKCTRNEIVIPGMVSRMSGKLNELTGMKIVVGPRESSGLPKVLRSIGG